MALLSIAETRSDVRSCGFRPYKSVHDAVKYLLYLLAHPTGYYRWILEFDVEKCFDKISHEWLLKHVPINKKIVYGFFKCGVWENGQFLETNAGTPQGGIFSHLNEFLFRWIRENYTRQSQISDICWWSRNLS